MIIYWYALSLQGISGPSSVYVNIVCERKHTADPVSASLLINYGFSGAKNSNEFFSVKKVCILIIFELMTSTSEIVITDPNDHKFYS